MEIDILWFRGQNNTADCKFFCLNPCGTFLIFFIKSDFYYYHEDSIAKIKDVETIFKNVIQMQLTQTITKIDLEKIITLFKKISVEISHMIM